MSFAFSSVVAPSHVAIRVAVQLLSCSMLVRVCAHVFVWCQEVCSYWAQISIIAVINGLNETQLGRGGKWFLTQPVLNKILFTVFSIPRSISPPHPPFASFCLFLPLSVFHHSHFSYCLWTCTLPPWSSFHLYLFVLLIFSPSPLSHQSIFHSLLLLFLILGL